MKIKNYVPNAFTMGNLFSGMVGTYFAANNALEIAAYAVLVGIFFDFFDGFFARKLNAQSEVGLQLDSLADVITSGVVPGIIMFQLLNNVNAWGDHTQWVAETNWHSLTILPFLGFAITLASAFRLAKFNIDERQSESFIGLPTPANALLIVSLPLILMYQPTPLAENLLTNTYFLIALTVLSCILLNAEIQLFALKFKTWGIAANKIRYGFLLLALILLFSLQFLAVPLVIILYVLISLLSQKKS
ncbi:MAG TPA: phosphatidylserine synthase [Leeuwenhoekiella sp.]|nr:phosphatidylserine synthase [Leeuwenhoekiella sp.]